MVIQMQIPNNNTSFRMNPGLKHKELHVQWTKEQMIEAFKSYDANGDGKLSKAELRQAFKYFGSIWSGRRASQAMARADNDRSGFIDITDKELEEVVEFALQRGYKVR